MNTNGLDNLFEVIMDKSSVTIPKTDFKLLNEFLFNQDAKGLTNTIHSRFFSTTYKEYYLEYSFKSNITYINLKLGTKVVYLSIITTSDSYCRLEYL